MKELEKLRKKIDLIDKKILQLLEDRLKVAKKIYEIKQKNDFPVFDIEREEEKIIWAEKHAKLLPKDSARKIFVEIFSATRKIGGNVKVAYLGPEGSFSHIAAINVFGSSAMFFPCDLPEVFAKVQGKDVDYGVIPIENSRDGIVGESLDLLIENNVKIIYELSMNISFCFFSNSPLERIKRIYSHQKAIAQCSRWIRENLRGAEVIYTSSTSEGAKMAFEDDEGGAIASEEILKFWNFRTVIRNIQDFPDERTDFAVISGKQVKLRGRIKDIRVSFCFSVLDEPGALFKALYPIAKRKINMKKIHSRPDKITKRYNFFVEIEKKCSDSVLEKTFNDIKKYSVFLKVFGEFPYRRI